MSSALNNTLQIHQVSSGLKSLPRRSMRPQARASFKVSAVLQNRPPRQEGDILQTIAKESDKFFQVIVLTLSIHVKRLVNYGRVS